ncbi:hypothetical protein [Micromonospora sp. CPCC 206061]|uniref:hypothetical protein n=1 Tax=Micromonospora sp. CPCC 206061 TaxID=3122410 RepID=UPI002FEFA4A1
MRRVPSLRVTCWSVLGWAGQRGVGEAAVAGQEVVPQLAVAAEHLPEVDLVLHAAAHRTDWVEITS